MTAAPRPAPEQCVILLDDTSGCDPLAIVGGRPFLAYLLWHARRFGFSQVLLAAGRSGSGLADFAADPLWTEGLTVEIAAYPPQAGTAGALCELVDRLDERFLLLNGAVLFDFNWLDLCVPAAGHPAGQIAVAQRGETGKDGGVYLVQQAAIAAFPRRGSFADDVAPGLLADGRAVARAQRGVFTDIRTPEGLAEAQSRLPTGLRRGAVFFDRDGVLNVDHGYTYLWEKFDWIPGAIEAVKAVNDQGLFAFLITNQSGVARGYYDEPAINALHQSMQAALRARGAHLDDIRYCPHHPEGSLPQYTRACDCRKPGPGMINDLAAHWPVDLSRSHLIGDKSSDMEAAAAAGLPATLFAGGPLGRVVSDILDVLTGPRLPPAGTVT